MRGSFRNGVVSRTLDRSVARTPPLQTVESTLFPSPVTCVQSYHISCWPRLDLEHGEQSLEGSLLASFFSQPDGEGEGVQVALEVRNARVSVPRVSALKGLVLAALYGV